MPPKNEFLKKSLNRLRKSLRRRLHPKPNRTSEIPPRKINAYTIWENFRQHLQNNSDTFRAGPLVRGGSFDYTNIEAVEPGLYTVILDKQDNPDQKEILHRNDQIILPVSLKRGSSFSKEVMPAAWGPNIYENGLQPLALHPGDKPRVGFCGFLNHDSRKRSCDILEECSDIECDFECREAYFGHLENKQSLIDGFRHNMKNNHFNLCNRGNGFHSLRLIETLSSGRIPALIDTESVLPFEGMIDWEQYIIIGQDESDLRDKILRATRTCNILEMQIKCRQLYEEYFLPDTIPGKLLDLLSIHWPPLENAN